MYILKVGSQTKLILSEGEEEGPLKIFGVVFLDFFDCSDEMLAVLGVLFVAELNLHFEQII
jgi:hypothetical protein